MPIQITNQTLIAPCGALLLAELPSFAERYLHQVPTTASCEALGSTLLRGPMEDDSIVAFVKAVCSWGGYAGISGRVLKHNTPPAIRTAIHAAQAMINATPPNVVGALAAINQVKYLGSPSFGSKHLRMLWPEHCAVLDSYLSRALDYPYSRTGYTALMEDLAPVAQAIEHAGLQNPFARPRGRWYLADAEAAIFWWVRTGCA